MKKLVMIFAAAGFVLASCGSSECITCTGTLSTLNACSDDATFANDEAWDAYVTSSNAAAELADETCTVE
jgi:hypothetical protein